VERSGDLKGELLRFAEGKRFANALAEAIDEWFGSTVPAEDHELIAFFEHFLFERRFSDGRTMVERFVRTRGDLPKTGEPARRALGTIGVTTLAELATHSRDEVAELHGMGPKGVQILEAALADAGLSFATGS
jgi:hypothetical protein